MGSDRCGSGGSGCSIRGSVGDPEGTERSAGTDADPVSGSSFRSSATHPNPEISCLELIVAVGELHGMIDVEESGVSRQERAQVEGDLGKLTSTGLPADS